MEKKITFTIVNDLEELNAPLIEAAQDSELIALAGIAKSATEGAAMVNAQKPDILIMDMELQHSNGIELLERIQDLSPKPVIIVTSRIVDRKLSEQFSALGVDYLIIRPFNNNTLLNHLLACAKAISKRGN